MTSINATNWDAIISKSKKAFSISHSIYRIFIKFLILWKKGSASYAIFFWDYRLQKERLLKYLKSPLSEHLWAVNILKGPKDCLSLNGSFFVMFFDPSDKKSAPKVLFY